MRWSCFYYLVVYFAGGTFALYSLICRHANVSLLPNRQVADEELSTYKYECPPEITNRSRIKVWLEKHKNLHVALLIVVMLGTCIVIGDGILTPAISGDFVNTVCYCNQGSHANVIFSSPVFSAVSGLELSMSKEHHECKLTSHIMNDILVSVEWFARVDSYFMNFFAGWERHMFSFQYLNFHYGAIYQYNILE